MNKPKISPDFTIEDIHRIREANEERRQALHDVVSLQVAIFGIRQISQQRIVRSVVNIAHRYRLDRKFERIHSGRNRIRRRLDRTSDRRQIIIAGYREESH